MTGHSQFPYFLLSVAEAMITKPREIDKIHERLPEDSLTLKKKGDVRAFQTLQRLRQRHLQGSQMEGMMRIEEAWRLKSDEEVESALNHLSDYTEEARRVIQEEIQRRAAAYIRETSASRKQEAHVLAITWWKSDGAAVSRAQGSGTCDKCNCSIPPMQGYLCDPEIGDYVGAFNIIGSATPDLVCERCFDRGTYHPWDSETTRRNLERATQARTLYAIDARRAGICSKCSHEHKSLASSQFYTADVSGDNYATVYKNIATGVVALCPDCLKAEKEEKRKNVRPRPKVVLILLVAMFAMFIIAAMTVGAATRWAPAIAFLWTGAILIALFLPVWAREWFSSSHRRLLFRYVNRTSCQIFPPAPGCKRILLTPQEYRRIRKGGIEG